MGRVVRPPAYAGDMLREMRIRNLGVIADAVLELSPGLNVITGETGAGKTMVVSGLGLLLGGRSDSGLVRSGSSVAAVEGILELPAAHPALERAVDAGADPQDCADGLILARSVTSEGRSRAHVSGRTVPAGVLADIGRSTVAVHGQADQWRLRHPEQHRAAVDRYGGATLIEALSTYRLHHRAVIALAAELSHLDGLERGHELEAEMLRVGLAELERVDPRPGEEEELRAEEERLSYADGLRAAAGRAHELLTGQGVDGGPGVGGAADLLGAARAELDAVASHDNAVGLMAERCADLAYQAADLANDLAGYQSDVDADPARLAVVQERRDQLTKVLRGKGQSIEEALEWGRQAATRLDELDGAPQRAAEVGAQLEAEREQLGVCAARVTHERRRAAAGLSAAIQTELSHLAMGSSVIDICVSGRPHPEGLSIPGEERPLRFGPEGVDDVEIRLAANPGASPRSVAKAASGGELSRVMLAVELVTGSQDLPTFVFDEVDAGVGGRAALDLGARLAALAQHAQVVVVTHLAQVAAFADRHLTVRKAVDGQVTSSDVRVLAGRERLREIARMMAGVEDSDAALDHARDLLSRVGRSDEFEAVPAGLTTAALTT